MTDAHENALDAEGWQRGFRLMLTSRWIDEVCKKHLKEGGSVPNYHSGVGQEALSVGVGLAAAERDYLLFTYRDFGMLLAKGVTEVELLGDLLLKQAGTTRGHGGIMHVSSPSRGIVGRNSVFGSRFGIAIGLGLAAKHRGQGQIVLCPFGEAEGGRGPLYEALNMAALDKLPVVFIAENNGYSIGSRTEDLYASGDMTGMFAGGPVPVSVHDGNQLDSVFSATAAAVARARNGAGPSLLEFKTYRIDPHIPADTVYRYRTDEEIAQWRARDPIAHCSQRLVTDGISSDDALKKVEEAVAKQVRAAFEEARRSPDPDLTSMYDYLYYPQGNWGAPLEETHA